MIKKDRLKMARAFSLVSERIKDCKSNLICFALDDLRCESLISSRTFLNCKSYVEKQLEGRMTYEAWVYSHDEKKFKKMKKLYNVRKPEKDPFRMGRLQWLKSMIKILEK